jgi:peptidoglycan/xylan/chitin deacetylase (PgdA/CDA1 family)
LSAPRLRVLTYHRVLDPAGLASDPALVSATPAGFDVQMAHLARRYRPVCAQTVLAAVRGHGRLPERAVLVTFDDAYRDFGQIAWPIMKRHGIPATVFVPTGFPDRPDREFWWDRLYRAFTRPRRNRLELPPLGTLLLDSPEARQRSARAVQRHLKRIPHPAAMQLVDQVIAAIGSDDDLAPEVLGWAELRALAADGVTLCAHTRGHPALDQLGPEEARAEILGGREDLEREVGPTLPIFAYPFGAHDDTAVNVVGSLGFELALTCRDGHNPFPLEHPLRLRRTNITPRTSALLFRLRLGRIFSHVDRWRPRAEAA